MLLDHSYCDGNNCHVSLCLIECPPSVSDVTLSSGPLASVLDDKLGRTRPVFSYCTPSCRESGTLEHPPPPPLVDPPTSSPSRARSGSVDLSLRNCLLCLEISIWGSSEKTSQICYSKNILKTSFDRIVK